MSSTTANPGVKRRCLRILRRVAPAYSVLPKSYSPPGVTLNGTIPHTSGGFADVWKGQLDGNQVCIKTFRTQAAAGMDKIRRVCASSLLRRGGETNLIPIRGSTVRPCGGSTFPIRTCYPSSEFRRRYPRFPSSPLGYQTETSLGTFENIRRLTDCNW